MATSTKTDSQLNAERDARIAAFDKIEAPYMKSRIMLAAERDFSLHDRRQGFINALGEPKYLKGMQANNVIMLSDTDAIIELEVVGPTGISSYKLGEKEFRAVIDNKCGSHIWESLEDAMLFYVAYKLEGREAAMNGDFVRYARRMLRPE